MKSNIGQVGEDRAVEFLCERGFSVIERNFRSKFGEIDIIALKDEVVHFVEVKATLGNYQPIERITSSKLTKILKTVKFFMLQNSFTCGFQIDAIVIKKDEIELIENISF